jgi:predicted dehydrogenase
MQAIANDTMLSPSFVDGVKCQEVLDAVVKSAAEKRWVEISEM